MPDIFLSYSREDNATAARFAQELGRAGFNVWWDQALRSGETYDEVTERALRDAKAVVVLWSRKSVQSRWVRSEAKIADRNGTFMPVMIEACDRPVMFELTQSADLTRWKGDTRDKGWCAFVDDVRAHVGRDVAAQTAPAIRMPRLTRLWLMLPLALLLLSGLAIWGFAGWRLPAMLHFTRPVSVAVLPLLDLTPEKSEAPLAEGLSDEIANWLAQIPELHVVARTSAFKFKDANQDVRDVGRQLNATHIVEGSVRRGQKLVRVTVQMVAVSSGYELWSKTFDLADSDPLHIEDTVSRSVAETLNATLTRETERRWKARQVNGREAQGLYIQARYEQRQRTAASNQRAMELYRNVIAQDPAFPIAYVSLAEATLNSVSLNGRDLAAAISEAEPLLDKALALSPDLPEAIAARGMLALAQYRTDEALRLMQHALALNPSDADTLRRMGNLYVQMARPREAIAQYDLAAGLDPLDFMTHVNRCLSLQDLAQYAAAQSACARARELNASNLWVPMATSWLEFGRGNLAAALQWINRAVEIAPDDASVRNQRLEVLLALQRYDAARAAVSALPESAEPLRSFQAASIAVEQNNQLALKTLIDAIALHGNLTADETLTLAGLQLASGSVASAKASLEHARQSAGFQAAGLVDPSRVRRGFSGAVIVAGIELAAGNRDVALQALKPLDDMLDRMEKDGAACSGLYALRAESLALRGFADRAMAALQRAHDQGWRLSQAARSDPSLQTLLQREDFIALMAQVDRQVKSIVVDPRALPP